MQTPAYRQAGYTRQVAEVTMIIVTQKEVRYTLSCDNCEAKVKIAIELATDFFDTGGCRLCAECVRRALELLVAEAEIANVG